MGNPSGPSGHLPYKAEEFCLRTDQLRRNSNPAQLSLGRYPTQFGSGRMSPRGRNKFLFAGFGRTPKSCRRDEKIRAPKKKFPALKKKFRAPKFFFRAPFFSDGGLEALFPAIWNFSTDKSPMSICRHKSRPAYAPRQSRRGNSRTGDKKKACALYLPTFWFPHVPRDCVFCARHRPLSRISESQGPSNDKVSNPRANSKMSNPSQRISGEA